MIARYSPILVFMSWCGVALPLEFKMVELGYRDIAKQHEIGSKLKISAQDDLGLLVL